MVAVSVARRTAEEPDHHVRAEGAHHANHVTENTILGPVLVRLVCILAEAEVEGAREVLRATVHPTRREQLLRANRPQRLAEFVADEILATVTAREREIRRFHVTPARQPRDNGRVFVVGVRGHREHTRRGADAGERGAKSRGAALRRNLGRERHGTNDERRGKSRGADRSLRRASE